MEALEKNMLELGFDESRLFVINNSLDYKNQIKYRGSLSISQLNEFRKGLFNNSSYKQLLFIGRLTKQKNIILLIDALANLRKQGHNFYLLIVGDGDGEKETFKAS